MAGRRWEDKKAKKYKVKSKRVMCENVRNDKLVRNSWLIAIHILFAFHFFMSPCYGQSWTADNGNGTFTNPLFYDEFSDPDILRVGDDYYLA